MSWQKLYPRRYEGWSCSHRLMPLLRKKIIFFKKLFERPTSEYNPVRRSYRVSREYPLPLLASHFSRGDALFGFVPCLGHHALT